jgi:shikimate kinase
MDAGNIYLVGMMGAGKSTVGRALARRLGREFVDTDRVLVERTGVPVATIFEIEGEAGFRRRESALVEELAARSALVVATGGGVVLDPANRARLHASGTVVYLRASAERLWDRTRRDTSRPLLATPDPRGTLLALLEHREPLYRECAHLTVDSGPQSASTLVTRLVNALRHPEPEGRSA